MHDRTDILNWRIIPHITVDDANAAIAFYERTFGARVIHRYTVPDGDKILHAALDFHGAELFLSDDFPEYSRQPSSPAALGGSPVLLHLDVPDVDAVFTRALEQGARADMPLMDQFWGARYGQFTDPFGHRWAVQTQRQYLTDEQLQEAARKAFTH